MFNIHPPAKDNILLPVVKALSPDEQAYFDDIISNINKQLKVSKDWLKTDEAKEFFTKRQEEIDKVFKSTELHDKLNEIVNHSADNSEDFIQNFYKIGAALGYEDLDRTLSYTPADKEALYAVSKYNFDLVKDVNDELRGGIKQVIFEGVATGKGPLSLVQQLEELPLNPIDSRVSVRTRAEMIARTEHARAVNTGTLQAYSNYGVDQVDIITAGDNLVCKFCLYYEAHSPYTLKEAMAFLPCHPCCRCSYAPHILGDLPSEPVENPKVVDLTNNVQPLDPDFDKLKTPEEIAEHYNLKYQTGNHQQMFIDEKHNTKIMFDQYFTEKTGSKKLLDNKNTGSKLYDMKDVIQIYNQSPEILKYATPKITFKKTYRGVSNNTLGQCSRGSKEIEIFPLAFKQSKTERGNLQQTLYHEMGHALDNSMTTAYDRVMYGGSTLSTGEKFQEACEKDAEYQRENDLPVEEASWYGETQPQENWAESVSMASYDKLADKSAAVMQDYDLNYVPYDEWVKRHPNKYKCAVDYLNSIKPEDFPTDE